MIKYTFFWIFTLLFVFSCQTVPVTGRKQFAFMPASEMQAQSYVAYKQFLDTSRLSANSDQVAMVKRVGERIRTAVEQYMAEKNLSSRLQGFQWEFNLIENKAANAWCMPGGKVVFYSGIMPICQDESGVAVVMGHEVAHAIAEHGNERMSQTLTAQGLLTAGQVVVQQNPTMFRQIMLQAAGVSTQLGLLKFSRQQESEADRIGLIFAALAGYDPQAAVSFWQRMDAQAGGQAPPEFLSTHPSHSTRIRDLNKWQAEAMNYYQRSRYKK